MDKQQKEKNELIELFGIHFETYYNLPPCGSRILGVLILNCRKRGMTFDELVESVNASKSTISTNINLLLKLGKINYYTMLGDRKKYFRSSHPCERIQNHLKFIDSEKKMIQRVKNYEENYPIIYGKDDEYQVNVICSIDTYMKYLIKFEQILNQSIEEEDL